jgi:hypothetical protein
MLFSFVLPLSLIAVSTSTALPELLRRDDAPTVDPQCWGNDKGEFVVIIPGDGSRSEGGYDATGNCAAGFRANLNGKWMIELDFECYYSTDTSTANSSCVLMSLVDETYFGIDAVKYAFNQCTYEQLSINCIYASEDIIDDSGNMHCPSGYESS